MGRKRGNQYRPMGFYRSDDRSGQTRRAWDTKQEWNGLIVDKNLWEIRQPQDFVQGTPDDQTVPDARPVPPAVFVGPLDTTLTRAALPGDTFLWLAAVNGFSAGQSIGVITDQGGYFMTAVSGDPTMDGVNIAGPVPYVCSKGNTVTAFIPNPGVYPNGSPPIP